MEFKYIQEPYLQYLVMYLSGVYMGWFISKLIRDYNE